MSELILFSLNAVVVYLVSDWLVRLIERRQGKVLKQRQVVCLVCDRDITGDGVEV